MKVLYFDLAKGVSEECLLSAMLDLDLDLNEIKGELSKLNLSNWGLNYKRDVVLLKNDNRIKLEFKSDTFLFAKKVSLFQVESLICESSLSQEIKQKGLVIIKNLFIDNEEISKQEVIKGLIYIFGILISVDLLQVKKVYASTLQISSSTQPSILELLEGCRILICDKEQVTTKLGVAIIVNLVDEFTGRPEITLDKVGVSSTDSLKKRDSGLKVILGQGNDEAAYQQDEIVSIETNIDDMNHEFYDYIFERLLQTGALDVYLTPIQMKKNRPAQQLTVLVKEDKLDEILKIIFTETTTLGVRVNRKNRYKLDRKFLNVKVAGRSVKVKLGYRNNRIFNIAPEYESCKKVALKSNLSLKEVYRRAQREVKKLDGNT